MCFRPAETGALPVICPECGKKVRPAQGQMPKNCPFCKSSLEGAVMAEPAGAVPTAVAPATPGAPVAPKAPGAPMAPKAPTASAASALPKDE